MERTALLAKLRFTACVTSPGSGEDDTTRGNPIPRGLPLQAQERQHPLRTACLLTGLVGEALQCPVRSGRSQGRFLWH